MKKVQYDRLAMASRVQDYLNENADLWQGNAPMVSTAAAWKLMLAELQVQMQLQLHKHTGITADKKEIRKVLEAKAFRISASCCSYALAVGNKNFYKQCRYTKSDLIHFRDGELAGECIILLGNVRDHAEELLPYGITLAMLDDFELCCTAFREITSKPVDAIFKKAEATAAIKALLPQIMNIIRIRLDADMVLLEDTQPNFVHVYRNLRRLHKSPVHKRALTVIVRDAETFKTLAKAEIVTDNKIKRKSGAKGQSYVAHLPAGRHKVEVSLAGYKVQGMKFSVVHGLATKVEVLMQKIFVESVNRFAKPGDVNSEMESVGNEMPVFVGLMASLGEETRLP